MRDAAPAPDLYLPAPAAYFPIRNGRYDTAPALHRLGTPSGNGAVDGHLFQIDSTFQRFRENKLSCRSERLGKYVCYADFAEPVREAVGRLIVTRLAVEHPGLFRAVTPGDREDVELYCVPTGERLILDPSLRLTGVRPADSASPEADPPYIDAFDALACQVPEDIAIVVRDAIGGPDRLVALHLCAPSRWAAEEKIGRDWSAIHEPVPGMERLRTPDIASTLVGMMIDRKPMVRFTWGIEFDDRLNRHPEPPQGVSPGEWQTRTPRCDRPDGTDAAEERLYLRVERQTIWGLPEVSATVFAIRVYHTPLSALRSIPSHVEALASALRSMSPDSLHYKSLNGCLDAVLKLLVETN